MKRQLSLIDLWPGAGDDAENGTEQLVDEGGPYSRYTCRGSPLVVKFPNSRSRAECRSRGLSKGNGWRFG